MSDRAKVLTGIALVVVVVAAAVLLAVRQSDSGRDAAACPDRPGSAWSPSNTEVDAGIDRHPFVGNGYLGLRVPTRGGGYTASTETTGWPLYTPAYDGAFVAGLYAHTPGVADDREVAAAVPNWSGLAVEVGGYTYDATTVAAQLSDYRQTLHLRCGTVRTEVRWTAPDGRVTDLVYEVLTSRTDQHVGAVRLTLVPHWSGELAVTDVLDGAGARRVLPNGGAASEDNAQWVGFRTAGTDIDAAVASVLRTDVDTDAAGHDTAATGQLAGLTAAQRLSVEVRAGHRYEFTKFVAVDTALTAPDPGAAARSAARRAAETGWSRLLADSAAAWRTLWRGDIETPDRPDVQNWIRGALYSLYSATNARQDNSVSPVGLSSDNYAGAVFWDADIWVFPALLRFAPELAKSIVEYRYRTLDAARANAERLGYRGAFYPWTSASRGDLAECHSWDPPHCLTQIHLQGDIAFAVWQYYRATGDTDWLRARGWPMLSSLAEFWTSRVTPNPDGSYSIVDIAGPDEYSNGVRDGVYTNAVAALALRNASRAAAILGLPADPEWHAVADRLRMPFDESRRIFLQFDGYTGAPIKQADTVLLIHPLDWPMPPEVATAVLDYYAQRTDPDGPAMTDSVHAVDAAAIGVPGCAVDTYLERAARPFVRAPFGQFAEARGEKAGAADPLAGAPAFTFVTAAGGFLQTFTDGLLGLRSDTDGISIDPMLSPRLGSELTVRGIQWQGRTFDARIGADDTRLTLTDGAPIRVRTPDGTHTLDRELTVDTRRPDRSPTDNLARCASIAASSAEPGRYPSAANDGSTATGWAADGDHATLTVDLGSPHAIDRVVARWTEPPTAFTVELSADGDRWIPRTPDPGTGDIADTEARYVRITVTDTTPDLPTGIAELEVYAPR
ncbi:discoidin domain-containing protein [Nocardia otitidiscaviarum]|uniref:discoidin domain-containing protein n=1 Tax=Nocardia otitidiscaviarum TaxID=1823 RepID=UPI002453D94A|nr:discoidin domain-containing protein [Nocardia otitidiscaviarum]